MEKILESAKKFCNLSCICSADCGLEKKGDELYFFLSDPGFVCPLRKYGITDGADRVRVQPDPHTGLWFTKEDVLRLCADCENGKAGHARDGKAAAVAGGRKCPDCIVGMAWEVCEDAIAEGRIN